MSIHKRGGSWRARYYGPDHRERSKSFKRKTDAERWLTQQRSQMTQGDWIDPARGRVTFGEYAPDWLEGRIGVKPKTRHQQASILRLHVMPTWQAVQLDRITFEGLTAGSPASPLAASVRPASARLSISCPPSSSRPCEAIASGLILLAGWLCLGRVSVITCFSLTLSSLH